MHLGKYIFTQQLRRLKYPERDALPVFDYIDALGEHPESKRKSEYAGPPIPTEAELWPTESGRNRFLADPNVRRLCVTVEGGVGKTKLLEELEAATVFDRPEEIVLRFDLRELPTKADYFLDSGDFLLAQCAEDEITGRRHNLQVQGLEVPKNLAVRAMVQSAARAGSLTLIVDAFDQLDKQGAFDRAKALQRFLSKDYYPNIRCIVAGRPYAIKRVWDALHLSELRSQENFEDGKRGRIHQPVWEFCKLQKFDSDQVSEYLSGVSARDGADKLTALKRMDAEEIHLPRTLNIIRQLTAGQLGKMQTAADLYWHAMNQTIIDNFRRARREYQLQHLRLEHVLPIVSAVACAMMFWKEEPVVEVPSIRTDKARDFFRFMKQAGFIDVLAGEGIAFELALLDLAQVDSESLQFHFYSESPTREAPSEVRDIRMSDATVRDFFAAHWVARYLAPQLDFLKARQQTEGDLKARLRMNVNTSDFKKFWQLLVGMPNQGSVSDEEAATEASWTAAVAPLFTVRENRPCELMYRCWPDLLWRAGLMEYRDHVDSPNWNETPMAAGTLKAQREVRRHFETGGSDDVASPAKRLVSLFLTDFLEQCKVQEVACMSDPNVTPAMKSQFYLDCDFVPINIYTIPLRSEVSERVRKERLDYLNEYYPLWLLECSFRVIEGGLFLYGDAPNPQSPSSIGAFEINAYVLSVKMFLCFDAGYTETIGDRLAGGGLSWYDSLMFSIWCFGRLPDEYQWEAAARGKIGNLELTEHWRYGFEGNESDLPMFGDFGRDYEDVPSAIGNRLPTTKAELYDIHGQLLEWCANENNYYYMEGASRVLRGGLYSSRDFVAGCSWAYNFQSGDSSQGHGCRVSRPAADQK